MQRKGSQRVLESEGTFNSDCKRFLLEASKMDEPGFFPSDRAASKGEGTVTKRDV